MKTCIECLNRCLCYAHFATYLFSFILQFYMAIFHIWIETTLKQIRPKNHDCSLLNAFNILCKIWKGNVSAISLIYDNWLLRFIGKPTLSNVENICKMYVTWNKQTRFRSWRYFSKFIIHVVLLIYDLNVLQ